MSYAHAPVMLEEVLKHLGCFDENVYVDGTLGGGGHAKAILEKILPRGRLVGIDCDKDGILASEGSLKNFRENLIIVKNNFRNIRKIWEELQLPLVNGILLDLGVSSYQLKEGERGFSFNQDYPLDMRLDRDQGITAEYLVNHLSYDELAKIIFEYGEERFSRRIAKAIIFERSKRPIKTTGELAEIVKTAVAGRGRIHPATRTFQALRIAVNDELKALEEGLSGALEILAVKGRIVVLSYHSLEDRIVKNVFRNKAKEGGFVLITKKPMVPSFKETRENPSSRSAKMRVIERIA
ncbi:MAG: 16S rRNA (cytosine(1402)-N(4))-methyltransferase RsmH [bacterium]|nr:16S rRNA (cytosine(1402)-N(4))-methyltransferase RsmH [bacterium]